MAQAMAFGFHEVQARPKPVPGCLAWLGPGFWPEAKPCTSLTVYSAVTAVSGLSSPVKLKCGPVQRCPDQHPAVTSVTLWQSVQNYPGCPVASRFADAQQSDCLVCLWWIQIVSPPCQKRR